MPKKRHCLQTRGLKGGVGKGETVPKLKKVAKSKRPPPVRTIELRLSGESWMPPSNGHSSSDFAMAWTVRRCAGGVDAVRGLEMNLRSVTLDKKLVKLASALDAALCSRKANKEVLGMVLNSVLLHQLNAFDDVNASAGEIEEDCAAGTSFHGIPVLDAPSEDSADTDEGDGFWDAEGGADSELAAEGRPPASVAAAASSLTGMATSEGQWEHHARWRSVQAQILSVVAALGDSRDEDTNLMFKAAFATPSKPKWDSVTRSFGSTKNKGVRGANRSINEEVSRSTGKLRRKESKVHAGRAASDEGKSFRQHFGMKEPVAVTAPTHKGLMSRGTSALCEVERLKECVFVCKIEI